jgi:cell division protein FtsW (lipid II flippase)
MWIDLGFMSIQPSEFIKPLLVLACATSIGEQQNRHKVGEINIVYDNVIIFGITAVVILFQWWCRDLGSIPTFAAIYASCFFMRICYPKAKFSKKTLSNKKQEQKLNSAPQHQILFLQPFLLRTL